MIDANGVLGIVKYAVVRLGSQYVVVRDGWKSIVANKLMYGSGTLAWYQQECGGLEISHNGMGRWLLDMWNVRNKLIRGETGWNNLEKRIAKMMVEYILQIMFEDNLMSDIGRTC